MRPSHKNVYGYETESDSPAVRDYISRRNTDPHFKPNKGQRFSYMEEHLRRKSTGEDYIRNEPIRKHQHSKDKHFQGSYNGDHRSLPPNSHRDACDCNDFDASFLSDTKQLINDCKALRSELSSGVDDVDSRLNETIREQIRSRDRKSVLEDRGTFLQDRGISPIPDDYEAGYLPPSLAGRPVNNGFQASQCLPLKNKVVYDAYHGTDSTSIRGPGKRSLLNDGGTQTLSMHQTNPNAKRQPHLESENGVHHPPSNIYGPYHTAGNVEVDLLKGAGYYHHHHHGTHHGGTDSSQQHPPGSGVEMDADVKLPNGGYYHHRRHHDHHDNHHSGVDPDKPKQPQSNHERTMSRHFSTRNSFANKTNASSGYTKCMSRIQRRSDDDSQSEYGGSAKMPMTSNRANKSQIPLYQSSKRRQHQTGSDRENDAEIDWEFLSKYRRSDRQQGTTIEHILNGASPSTTGEETSSVLFQNSNIKLLLVQKPKQKTTTSTDVASTTGDKKDLKTYNDDNKDGVDIGNFVKDYKTNSKKEDDSSKYGMGSSHHDDRRSNRSKHPSNKDSLYPLSPDNESIETSGREQSQSNTLPHKKHSSKHEKGSSHPYGGRSIQSKSPSNKDGLYNLPPNNESGRTIGSDQSQTNTSTHKNPSSKYENVSSHHDGGRSDQSKNPSNKDSLHTLSPNNESGKTSGSEQSNTLIHTANASKTPIHIGSKNPSTASHNGIHYDGDRSNLSKNLSGKNSIYKPSSDNESREPSESEKSQSETLIHTTNASKTPIPSGSKNRSASNTEIHSNNPSSRGEDASTPPKTPTKTNRNSSVIVSDDDSDNDDKKDDEENDGDNTLSKRLESDTSVTKYNSRSANPSYNRMDKSNDETKISGSKKGSGNEKLNETLSSTSANSDYKGTYDPKSDKSSVYGSASELPTDSDFTGLKSKDVSSIIPPTKYLVEKDKDDSNLSNDDSMISQEKKKMEKSKRPPKVKTLYVVKKPKTK